MTCIIAGFRLEETRSCNIIKSQPKVQRFPWNSLSKGGQRGSVEEALLEFGAL